MNVKQTIQRVSDCLGRYYVVGATRYANAVAELEFLFNEIGSMTNLLSFLTTNHPMNHTACHRKHVLSNTHLNTFNRIVVKLQDFF